MIYYIQYMMKFIVIIGIIFPLSLFGGKLTDAEIEYFLDVTLNSETSSNRQRTIQKWNQDIKIKVHQDIPVTVNDLANLHSVIATLNPLLRQHKIYIVEEGENINFHLTNRVGLKTFGNSYIGGFAQVWSDSSGSESATIGVDINFGAENDGTRRPEYTDHITTEELTQSLGLFADSRAFEDSIFYEDFNVLTSISTLDKKLINILYHPEIKVGMNEAQLYALLPTLDYNDTAVLGQVVIPEEDDDGDGLTNAVEAILGTDHTKADTDEDGLSDKEEVDIELDPLTSTPKVALYFETQQAGLESALTKAESNLSQANQRIAELQSRIEELENQSSGGGSSNQIISPSSQQNAGWLWHNWPWVYSAQRSGWLYFYPHKSQLYVYEVASGQWAEYSVMFGN